MKFHKKYKIENVTSYRSYPNDLLFTKGGLRDKKVYMNDICLGEGVTNYQLFNDKVLFNKWKIDDSFIYDTINGTTTEVKDSRFFTSIDSIVIYKDGDEYVYKDEVFKPFLRHGKRFVLIEKNYGIIIGINSILAQSLSKKILWEFDLHDLKKPKYDDEVDQIDKLIGRAYNAIWFTTKGGRLIALDVKTGSVTKKYSTQAEDFELGYETTLKGTNLYLNNDYIYGMSANFFQKINTKSLEIEESFEFRKENPHGMETFEYVYSPLLQGDYFTFLGEKRHTDGIRFIGLFDYKKRKLVWEYELISKEEFKNGNKLIIPEPVYLSGNKLYVKDFESTLHILEKENTELA